MSPNSSISPESFIARWKDAGGKEIANSQSFLNDLCDLIGVERPEPYKAGTANDYVFEREVAFGESGPPKRIDLYRKGCFILESKQGVFKQEVDPLAAPGVAKPGAKGIGVRESEGWRRKMLNAKTQARNYARHLPDEWPPFLIVSDVGYCLDLYADFSGLGKNYQPFSISGKSRLYLSDLADETIRETVKTIWEHPRTLDPSEHAKVVSYEVAKRLALLAPMLEEKHDPHEVAAFLMRCLFTMFAEDVGLLPERTFTDLLDKLQAKPKVFKPAAEGLWRVMNEGGFYQPTLDTLLKFNGGLFADPFAFELTESQIRLLHEAAELDWSAVEPAIFGTLLERALDPVERHKLGAHYTPREYVERLVLPTVIEPLRREWEEGALVAANALKEEAERLESEGKDKPAKQKKQAAIDEVERFHRKLCQTRVLDPACGSGNFLYVALANMKELEQEVVTFLAALGVGQQTLALSGLTVDPHQFLGIEINPHATTITEMVLWIGYLQWHFRTHGNVNPPEPVLKRYRNIEHRDAVLLYDEEREKLDADGKPVTVWNFRDYCTDPVSGKKIPDETKRQIVYEYTNPREAAWPEADYVVSNPPFIGNKVMRRDLGDGYTETLRTTYANVPQMADYVMYWWDKAARLVREGRLKRFGLITTNSITQTFNRKVIEAHTSAKNDPLEIAWAIPDHPWIDAAEGAAVRIAMTIGAKAGEDRLKRLGRVVAERKGESTDYWARAVDVAYKSVPVIHGDLSGGADVAGASELKANLDMAYTGMYPLGQGFVVFPEEYDSAVGNDGDTDSVLKTYFTARDLTQKDRQTKVVDFFPRTKEEARSTFPSLFQRILEQVKPKRDQDKRAAYRDKWWLFAEPRTNLRAAIADIERFILVPRTAKHFSFQFVPSDAIPDSSVVAIASNDAYVLGVLSTRIHKTWALFSGGTLEDRPRYQHKRTFNPFPFPEVDETQRARIRELGEKLDAHRKRVQATEPKATLTNQYNAMERLRQIEREGGPALTDKERTFHDTALIGVLKSIHDDLDSAVFDAYGWPATLTDDEILERLVDLNARRAKEEEDSLIRWLRPEYQNPSGQKSARQTEATLTPTAQKTKAKKAAKRPWPADMAEQAQAVAEALEVADAPVTPKELAKAFTGANAAQIESFLRMLANLGKAHEADDGMYVKG